MGPSRFAGPSLRALFARRFSAAAAPPPAPAVARPASARRCRLRGCPRRSVVSVPPRLALSSARGAVRCSPSAVLRMVCFGLHGSLRPASLPFGSPSAGLRFNVCFGLRALPFRSSRGLRGCVASASRRGPCFLRLVVRSPSVALAPLLGPLALLVGAALLGRVASSRAAPPAAPLRAWLLAPLPALGPFGPGSGLLLALGAATPRVVCAASPRRVFALSSRSAAFRSLAAAWFLAAFWASRRVRGVRPLSGGYAGCGWASVLPRAFAACRALGRLGGGFVLF